MNREIAAGLAWGGTIVVVALGARYARNAGLLDQDTVQRIVFCLIGLMVAWYANLTPKRFVPNAFARQAARVSGWSMALSGLVFALLWMFAPIPVAVAGGVGAVLAGIVVTFSYCYSLRDKISAT